MNTLPGQSSPRTARARGSPVGAIDMVIETGDIANRMEVVTQCPSAKRRRSWAQFSIDYINGLNLFDQSSNRGASLACAGQSRRQQRHRILHAHGADHAATSMAGSTIFMAESGRPLTASTSLRADKIQLLGGSRRHPHGVPQYVPDSASGRGSGTTSRRSTRARPCSSSCTIRPPSIQHFINPNGLHDINTVDKFENLPRGSTRRAPTINAPSTIEQRAFATFLKAHKNVVAYSTATPTHAVHDWNGPDGMSFARHPGRFADEGQLLGHR